MDYLGNRSDGLGARIRLLYELIPLDMGRLGGDMGAGSKDGAGYDSG